MAICLKRPSSNTKNKGKNWNKVQQQLFHFPFHTNGMYQYSKNNFQIFITEKKKKNFSGNASTK